MPIMMMLNREARQVQDGWQLWETITEGSPISPAFTSQEELASWLTENPGSHQPPGGDLDYSEWMEVIQGKKIARDIHTGRLS